MGKEKPTKKTVLLVVTAFILGAVVGYTLHNITQTRTAYSFEAGENILQNSGFEYGSEDEPNYWFPAIVAVNNLTMSWDNEIKYNGSKSVSINNTHIYDETVCNNWAQTINKVPKERTVKLSGWVKTTDAENIVMVIQCWNILGGMVGFGTTQTATEINGTNDWQMYNASVYVPNDTCTIIVRLVLTGTGQVWFDDVRLVIK
ncbi:MAG: hypothetical protein U9R21_00915 [Candidatus Thermoplasmatota archaeon]|nr:hypothetical protein [Candidatus Thermoplasmatota archaeon]